MNTRTLSTLRTAIRKVDAELERLHTVKQKVDELEAGQAAAVKDQTNAEVALGLAQATAEETQRELALELTGLADEAVRCLFPKYIFEATAVHRSGRLEVEFNLVDQEGHRTSPLLSNGGGVVDLLAFALRVVGVKMTDAAPLVVLDEPFRFISAAAGLRARAAELISQLQADLGTDFLIVSHDPELTQVADHSQTF